MDQEVLAAVGTWVERHPQPEKPALSMFGRGSFTPRQIHEHMSNPDSEMGKEFWAMFDHAISATSKQELIESFLRETPKT